MKIANFIEPHFQPIVMRNGQLYALEALFRFRGSDSSPQSLMTRWEHTGYVAVADLAMVRRVREVLSRTPGKWRVSVNVSALTLELAKEDYLVELQALAAIARRVIVELTDAYPARDPAPLADFARRCQAAQMYVAFDDCKPPQDCWEAEFVRQVKPNFLKIDGEMLGECHRSGVKGPARDVVRLANAIGATPIAEWIDSPEKRDFAIAVGARLLQGHFIGRPKLLAMSATRNPDTAPTSAASR